MSAGTRGSRSRAITAVKGFRFLSRARHFLREGTSGAARAFLPTSASANERTDGRATVPNACFSRLLPPRRGINSYWRLVSAVTADPLVEQLPRSGARLEDPFVSPTSDRPPTIGLSYFTWRGIRSLAYWAVGRSDVQRRRSQIPWPDRIIWHVSVARELPYVEWN